MHQRQLASVTVLLIFGMLALGSVDNGPSKQATTSSAPPETPRPGPKQEVLNAIKLDFKWGKTGFDNVMDADFTITNPTVYTIKDITITCVHFAPSGTRIDSNSRTIYEIIAPKGKKMIRGFNMGFIHSQVKSSSCTITDLVVAQ